MSLDIASNRSAQKWTRKELIGRAFWEYLGAPIFSLVPRPLWSLRCAILRIFGARLGSDVHISSSTHIAIPWNLEVADRSAIGDRVIIYNLGKITLEASVTISHGAHLCAGTHDYKRSDFPLIKAPITVRSGAWICADAFIGPGVEIGAFAIIGACSVIVKDANPHEILVGNPSRCIGFRQLDGRK